MGQEDIKMNRVSWKEYFMGVAELISKRSTCCRIGVGAVLVSKENRIISTGYNGVTRGAEHCYEYFKLLHENEESLTQQSWDEYLKTDSFKEKHKRFSSENEIHAEANAILGNSFDEMSGGTIYCTLSPCEDCAKLIKAAGIKTVIYRHKYDRPEGLMAISFLTRNKIEIFQY